MRLRIENADDRVRDRLLKRRADAQDDGFAGAKRVARFAGGVKYPHIHNATGAVSVAKAAFAGDGFFEQAGAAFLGWSARDRARSRRTD